MDVLHAAWIAAGEPHIAGDRAGVGRCGRCAAADTTLLPAASAVSKVFTAWDQWRNPNAPGLCNACTWGYRHSPLRTHVHLVTTEPRLACLSSAEVYHALAVPLPPDTAVILPLRPGRKHLLPQAQWGRVNVDDAALSWTSADVERLAAVRRLRRHGVGSRMLTEAAPPFGVMRRVGPPQHAALLADWDLLAPWRRRPLWLNVALRCTTTNADGIAA